MKVSSFCSLAVLLAIAATATTSCSGGLSRENAAVIISKADSFRGPLSLELSVGNGRFFPDECQKSLAALGILNITPPNAWGIYKTQLTAKGSAAFDEMKLSGSKSQEWADNRVYVVPLVNRSLVEVTGISDQNGGREASVEFSWKFSENPSLGLLSVIDYTAAHKGTALMKLYDDGWRVEKVDLGLVGDLCNRL